MTPSLSLAQFGSGQGGNGSVPKKEREIHGVDFRVVNWLFLDPSFPTPAKLVFWHYVARTPFFLTLPTQKSMGTHMGTHGLF